MVYFRISETLCEIIANTNNIISSKIHNIELLCINLMKASQIFSQFNIKLNLGIKNQYSREKE